MSNPQLTNDQRIDLFAPLFAQVITSLESYGENDLRLIWALRRKLAKELIYLERGTPSVRKKLKTFMWTKQKGMCSLCNKPMPEKDSELDRTEAYLGYVEENVRLVHHECHVNDQAIKGYA
jgi:hypothetical protein